jgi:hypothetical protein
MNDNSAKISSKSLIRIATVEQIEDNLDTASPNSISRNSFGHRIKVRLHEDDQQLNGNDLPWAWPLLPKHLQIIPKVGEEVLIFLQELDGAMGNRFYIGPIISQDYYLDHGGQYEALSLMKGLSTKPLCHPVGNPKNDGTYPDQDTIAFQGRGDSAMWLKDEELRLMCGHKPFWNRRSIVERADPGSLEFNKEDLSYIQMKYDKFNGGKENGGFNSAISVVADRINLITHNGANKESYLNVTDQKELITKESVEKFSDNGQRMVYGDELIAFLEKFRQIFADHTHHWSNDKQVMSAKDVEFWSKNLDELLCKTIRIA